MKRYIHTSGPIRDKYKNLPKRHKLEGFILVGERDRILHRKGVEVPVYYLFHEYFPDVELFASRH